MANPERLYGKLIQVQTTLVFFKWPCTPLSVTNGFTPRRPIQDVHAWVTALSKTIKATKWLIDECFINGVSDTNEYSSAQRWLISKDVCVRNSISYPPGIRKASCSFLSAPSSLSFSTSLSFSFWSVLGRMRLRDWNKKHLKDGLVSGEIQSKMVYSYLIGSR